LDHPGSRRRAGRSAWLGDASSCATSTNRGAYGGAEEEEEEERAIVVVVVVAGAMAVVVVALTSCGRGRIRRPRGDLVQWEGRKERARARSGEERRHDRVGRGPFASVPSRAVGGAPSFARALRVRVKRG
jgi:hypothetical protein